VSAAEATHNDAIMRKSHSSTIIKCRKHICRYLKAEPIRTKIMRDAYAESRIFIYIYLQLPFNKPLRTRAFVHLYAFIENSTYTLRSEFAGRARFASLDEVSLCMVVCIK